MTDEMRTADRKAERRLRDYRAWKRQPREPLIPEDEGREVEFAWGDAWDLGWTAARALDPQVASLEAVLEAIEMRIRELQGDRRNFDHLSTAEERELAVLRSVRDALATTQKG